MDKYYKYVRKWMKRSGIRRLYAYMDPKREGRLLLEVVICGKVLFIIKLWKLKPLIKD